MFPILIYLTLAIIAGVFAWNVPAGPWGLILTLLSIALLSAGASEYWHWLSLAHAEITRRQKSAERRADIEYLEAVDRVTRLVLSATTDQARIIQSLNAVVICKANAGDPIYQLQVGDYKTADWQPVEEFLRHCSPIHLAPIGSWGEGPMREFAQKLTAFFIARGYAEPASGNRPARWVDRAGALNSIGM